MSKPKASFLTDTIKDCANKVADKLSADVLLINAEIERSLDEKLISLVNSRNRRKHIFLILVTPGGDPDAAYRIARCLQDSYDHFIVFVTGYCKSAGTLCVLGANEIVMSEAGELGPLDVQLYKKDELFELSSGLVAVEALQILQRKAFEMFEEYFLSINIKSAGRITFKTATEIAMNFSVGLFEPLYKQIDPVQVGEMTRSLKIATAYGKRLMVKSQNYTEKTLEILSETYPSHGFVIDKREAVTLFKNVRQPSGDEDDLRHSLENLGYTANLKPEVIFLSDEIKGDKNESTPGNIEQTNNKKTKQRTNPGGDRKNP